MKRRVALDYTLGEGWLAPWRDGLREGKAVASACSACGTAQFPPLRICPACSTPSDGWRALSGAGDILFRTTGTDGDIAMIRFDGSSGSAIARADALPKGATRATLAPCPDDPPILALTAEPET